MVEQKDSIAKILVVSGESFSSALMDYALKMAQRLDFEIISLNINEKIMTMSETEQGAAKMDFDESAKKSAGQFAAQGRLMGVKVTSIIVVNNLQSAITDIEEQEPGIRYILSEPDPKQFSDSGDRVQNPVFNLVYFG